MPTSLSPNSITALRDSLGLTRAKFARMVGRTERAIIDWEAGRAEPQGLSQQRLQELKRLIAALRNLINEKTLGPWFDTPNPAFAGLKPIEVIERGQSDRLWRMIFKLESGSHV